MKTFNILQTYLEIEKKWNNDSGIVINDDTNIQKLIIVSVIYDDYCYNQMKLGISISLIFAMLIVFSITDMAWGQNDTSMYEQELVDELVSIRDALTDIDSSNIDSFFMAFIIGAMMGSIAISATFYQTRNLKKQLKATEEHMTAVQTDSIARIRPIITRDQFQNGSIYEINVAKNDHYITLSMKIINRGQVHAIHVKKSFKTHKLNENDICIINTDHPNDPMPDMAPNEYVIYTTIISKEDLHEINNGTKFSFNLSIEYDNSVSGMTNEYHLCGHFEEGNFILDDAKIN